MGNITSKFVKQSIVYSVPVSKKIKGETEIRRHPQFKDKLHPPYLDKARQTLRDVCLPVFQSYPNTQFLGTKISDTKYEFKTYGQCHEIIKQLGSGILNMNLAPEVSDYQNYKIRPVGILSKNREEWMLLDMVAAFYGYVLTGLYPTMPDFTGSMRIAGITTIFGSKQWFDDMMKIEGNFSPLKTFVCFDKFDEKEVQMAKAKGFDLISYEKIVEEGKKKIVDYHKIQVKPDDIQSFIFTSGTTGTPKCTIITNKNIVCYITAQAQPRKYPAFLKFEQELSLALYAHMAERVIAYNLVATGATIHYSSYNPAKLLSEYQLVKPTIMISTTRFFNTVYNLIIDQLSKQGDVKRYLFQLALKQKLARLEKGQFKHFFWDQLVFNRIRNAIVGDRIRLITSGGQPCTEKVFNTLRVIFGVPFVQVFGITEGVGTVFETLAEDPSSVDHVGGPSVLFEFKLIDKPEYGYYTDHVDENGNLAPRGEIAIRGDQMTKGYYKNPKETEKLFTKDGFVLTGDIGELMPNGALKILDRTKNVFKLLIYPEYICPEFIENVYTNIPFIENIFLYGDYLKEYCVAIVQPKKQVFVSIAKSLNISGSFEEICKHPKMYEYVMKAIEEHNVKAKVKFFEQPKKIYIEPKTFGELGLLTLPLKIARAKTRNYYKPIIDQLYEQKLDKKPPQQPKQEEDEDHKPPLEPSSI